MKLLLAVLGLVVALASAQFVVPHGAERVLFWNQKTLTILESNRMLFFQNVRALTVVHNSIYRALRDLRCFGHNRVCDAETAEMTVDVAASFALTNLFPNSLVDIRQTCLRPLWANVTDEEKKETARTVGEEAAVKALEMNSDLVARWESYDVQFTRAAGSRFFRPFPDAYVPDNFAQLGNTTLSVIPSVDFNPPIAYPSLSSADFQASWNETYYYGSATSTVRTAYQGETAIFWASDVGVICSAIQDITRRVGWNLNQAATVFKIRMMAAYDAHAVNFYWKHTLHNLRPINLFFDGLTGHPEVPVDKSWRPYIPTPVNPEYPCGHCTQSSTYTHLMPLLLGGVENMDVTYTQFQTIPPITTLVRTYHSFESVREEVFSARIHGGMHFRFSAEAGKLQGKQIAEFVFEKTCKDRKCITENKEIPNRYV